MHGLEQKVAIVTGGGGAIGRAICRRFAEEGSIVGVFDINEEAARETAVQIDAAGGSALVQQVDITDYDAVAAAAAAFEAATGPAEILVNNAGWDRLANFLDTDPAFWNQIIAINLLGALNLHHTVVPGMVERGGGKVINIASDAGRVGSSGEAVYSACKGGIIAFTKTLARELARNGVCCNAVAPGPVDTPLLRSMTPDGDLDSGLGKAFRRAIPMRRLGEPDDMPGIVAFLASEDANFITGQVISVSGGLTMSG
ncbi:MAG: glucose 1-dehydrogenase [Alphaproteobacteria bacterium]|nr:glucose 1-dehydrogenase [Alphaproteobacteria bacterium]